MEFCAAVPSPPPQAALKAFDDDHNGSLDKGEFERFAKSLMKSGGWGWRLQQVE
jgi:hypothetical protein